jgi:uncharacterized membrane protein YuzA (DUF378 family)
MNLSQISWWLMVIGALNWGLTAFGMNLVNMLVGSMPAVEMVVYVLVGLSGLYALLHHFEIV